MFENARTPASKAARTIAHRHLYEYDFGTGPGIEDLSCRVNAIDPGQVDVHKITSAALVDL